jgi:hypothetical protein
MAEPFLYRPEGDLMDQVRTLAAASGGPINGTLNDVVRAGLVALTSDHQAARRLNDPVWVEAIGAEIRSEHGEVIDLLSR